MNLLAVDTASKSCSVAILRDGIPVAELFLESGETHSKHLMPMVASVTHQAAVSLSEIDAYAVTTGPGSFTGLRIGISAVKGLAAAAGKAVAGVSALEALAFQFPWIGERICGMMDAKRGEVYFSVLQPKSGGFEVEVEERVTPPREALSRIQGVCLFVGDGAVAYRDLIVSEMGSRARFARPFQNSIRASAVGCLGMQKLERGKGSAAQDLQPVYLRRSDAEIQRDKRRGLQK